MFSNASSDNPLLAGIKKTLLLINGNDRKKLVIVAIIQVLLGILDLLGVAVIGMLATIAVRGLQSQQPGDRVSQFLEFVGLNAIGLQKQLIILGSFAVLVLTLKTIISIFFLRKTFNYLSLKGASITNSLLSRLLNTNIEELQQEQIQQHIFNLTNGVNNLIVGVLNNAILIISDLSLLVILTTGLLIVDPAISILTLLLFAFLGYCIYFLTHTRASKLGKELTNLSVESSQDMYEVITSYREVFVKGGREHYLQNISKLRNKLAKYDAEMKFLPNISKYVAEIGIVTGALLISTVLFATQDKFRAIGILAVFMAASTRIAPAVMRIQQNTILMKVFLNSSEPTLTLATKLRNVDLLDSNINHFSDSHSDFEANIGVSNLTFTYSMSTKSAVENINLDINQGQMVALVGPSGGGKSTLVDLILGLLQPDAGVISVSGMNPIFVPRKWPGAIGFVPQKVSIHNGSLKENLCLGYNPDEIPEKNIWDALEIANLKEFVENLPGRFSYKIEDNGSNFSGGQLQRLGIARALVTKPKLLIFDEATSSLDADTEQKISDSILALKGATTLLIVAHRLSTIRQADKIFYVDNGRIVAQGTFDELLKTNLDFRNQAKLMGII